MNTIDIPSKGCDHTLFSHYLSSSPCPTLPPRMSLCFHVTHSPLPFLVPPPFRSHRFQFNDPCMTHVHNYYIIYFVQGCVIVSTHMSVMVRCTCALVLRGQRRMSSVHPAALHLSPLRRVLSLNLELMAFQLDWGPASHRNPPFSTTWVTGTWPCLNCTLLLGI